jgi:hypothetical protein
MSREGRAGLYRRPGLRASLPAHTAIKGTQIYNPEKVVELQYLLNQLLIESQLVSKFADDLNALGTLRNRDEAVQRLGRLHRRTNREW